MRWLPGTILALLLLAYPFLSQTLIARGWGSLLPLAVAGWLLWRAWRSAGFAQWLWLGLGLALLGGSLWFGAGITRWVPTVALLLVAWGFGRTLLHPPPLIERIVRLSFQDLPPYILAYLYRLTWIWTGFFLIAALISAGLTLAGSESGWLKFHGIGIYLAMAGLLGGEYCYRRWRFPELDRAPPPHETLREIVKNGKRLWQE